MYSTFSTPRLTSMRAILGILFCCAVSALTWPFLSVSMSGKYVAKLEADLDYYRESSKSDRAMLNKLQDALIENYRERKLERQDSERKLFDMSVQYVADTNTRPILEWSLRRWHAKEMSNTTTNATESKAITTADSVKLLVSTMTDKNGKLTPEMKTALNKLGDQTVTDNAVAAELKVLYHNLSRKVHTPKLPGKTGFMIGGTAYSLCTRVALALCFLKLQSLLKNIGDESIAVVYCTESFQPLHYLKNGEVTEYR